MFSEASVSHSHSVHGGGGGVVSEREGLPSGGSGYALLVLTSSGGHCSGRYASFPNAFLFFVLILS